MKSPAHLNHPLLLTLIVLVLALAATTHAGQQARTASPPSAAPTAGTDAAQGPRAASNPSVAPDAPKTLPPATTQSGTDATQAALAPARAAPDSPAALDVLKTSIKAMKLQDSLLAGYCYQKILEVQYLGDDLSTKKTETRLIEVTSIPHGPDIEVLVAVNGKPISEKERRKREADQRQRAKRGETQLNMRSEDLITQFDWSFAGREKVNGRQATVLAFKPKPGATYDGNDSKTEKFMRKVSGRVWVDDEESTIAKMEFRSLGSVKSLGGLYWTVNSFFVREERRRLPEGVWIDSSGEYFIDAKALLVKRIVRRQIIHTDNYRKCS